MKPTVSIIIPYLDQELYLGEAIESVQAQSLTNWEMFLVDDGSRDGSPSIASRYAASDRRIRLLSHPGAINRGAAASRNVGLHAANGELVTFLDGDDFYLPGKLAIEAGILDRVPHADAVYGRAYWRYSDGRPEELDDLGIPADRTYSPPELATRILLWREGAIPCTCSIMIRRECAISVGGFVEGLALYEDQSFWAKLFLKHPVHVSNHCAAVYRQHPKSTSAAAIRRGWYDDIRPNTAQLAFLEWLEGFVRSEGVVNRELSRALKGSLVPYRAPVRFGLRLLKKWAVRRARALGQIGGRRQPMDPGPRLRR